MTDDAPLLAEIEVLEMLAGETPGRWGARVSACLEGLQERGLCTGGPHYRITAEGRDLLRARQLMEMRP